MKTPTSNAKAENGFAPNASVKKSDPDKLTFTIKKSEKVTSAKMYQIIDGKVSSNEIKLSNIKKSGSYITSFTFAKEGMYRLKLTNQSGESAACLTDFVISKKNNTETWRVNVSPRAVKSEQTNELKKIKISDGAIKSINIYVKENGKYDKNKPIYTYENGTTKKTTSKYIDETNSNYKDNTKIVIALKRLDSNKRYMITVTDKAGSDPELVKNRMILVDKTAKNERRK